MKLKHYILIALGVAVIILLFFLLQGDKQHDSHKDDMREVKRTDDTLKARDAYYRHIIDSLSIDNYRLDSTNKSLIKGQTVTERKLNAKAAEVRTLVEQIRSYNQDTGYFGHLLDSLESQVESLNYLIVQYEQYADSINNVNDSVKINYESILREKDKRYAELKSAYDKLLTAYTELFDTSRGLMKDLKRQKLKTKVASVLGAAGLILGAIKM